MSKFREKVVEGKEFIITCEFVPGRGAKGKSVEEAVEFGKKVVSGKLPIHAVSITDNPGGNPAISPDILGKELYGMGLDSLRSEEHTSELQSHSFISYAVFCLKKKISN